MTRVPFSISPKGTEIFCYLYNGIYVLISRFRRVMSFHYALNFERVDILRSTRRKSERAMHQHRSFCLPESEQASRQARQEPDGMTDEARDGGLSGSGTDG